MKLYPKERVNFINTSDCLKVLIFLLKQLMEIQNCKLVIWWNGDLYRSKVEGKLEQFCIYACDFEVHMSPLS